MYKQKKTGQFRPVLLCGSPFSPPRRIEPQTLFSGHKKKADRKRSAFAPLFYERCNYNKMIEYVTIWKLKA
jgi:hypothetical protein